MSEMLYSLCLFTVNGATFTFRNVTVITDNEKVIQFSYKAMSDGKVKTGTAIKANLAAVSRCP